MRYGKDRRLGRLRGAILCIAAAAGLICAVIYLQMVKHMKEICEYKGRQTANALVAQAVDDCLLGENGDYLQIEYAEDGGIAAITADTYRINALENKLRRQINEEFSHIEDNEMGVPLGTLSGITALSGRGAEVRIKLHQVGAVDVSLKSEFESAGINQTRHCLKVVVKSELSAILPGHSTDITAEDEYLISETVIAGELPQGLWNTADLLEN